ncbi:MAG: PAS domain S-box protein [Methanothrix sp.]|nr:MAG: PAS domain S-box protein [Methanothrix sp.]
MYKFALDHMPDAVIMSDPDGKITYMNPALERLVGSLTCDTMGTNCTEVLGEHFSEILRALQEKSKDAASGRFDLNGRVLEYSASRINEGGRLLGVIIILKDAPSTFLPSGEECGGVGSDKSCCESGNERGKKDRILAGAALAANQLLITREMDLAFEQAMEALGCSADVDRVCIFENIRSATGERCCKLRYEWANDIRIPKLSQILPAVLSYDYPVRWGDCLEDGMPLKGLARNQPVQIKAFFEQLNVLSFLAVPIFAMDRFWGFISFDDLQCERIWTWNEVSVLMTIASAIGGIMDRYEAEKALRESEEKYRELVESANSIIMRTDTLGRITFFNKFAQSFFGYSDAEILGKNALGTIVPLMDSEGRDLRELFRDLAVHPESYASNVNENMRRNGVRVWIAWTNRPVLNERGEVVEILSIGNDITENKFSSRRLKEAAQDLRETRDYLENLIAHANAPIIVWDPSFKITRFNHAFERLTDHNARDMLGKPLDILFPDASRSASLSYIRKTLAGERWDAVEIPILRRDGTIRTVLWNSATIYDEEGRHVVATIAQGQDITERNQAQEQVRFQASLLDQVRNSVIATDLRGNIIYWNRFAEVLYQYTAQDVLGKSIAETIVPIDRHWRISEIMAAIESSSYLECELRVRRKDGSIFPAFYTFNALKDLKGKHIGFVGVSVDLTERKRAEQDLRLAKERAESATKAKSEFLANMSHEIRTPMNAVIGLTGLLLNTEIDEQQRGYIEIIRSSGDALLSIISDILDFSKIEGGMLELESQPFDLIDCLEASIDLVEDAAVKKGLSISYTIPPTVPSMIVGDSTRLRQVLVNLLSNAVKFTEKGSVYIAVSSRPAPSGHEIQFSVRDTGIGISEDRMNRLFQSFSQVDASMTRKYGGTGLGLAISKHLVSLMGGSIRAESNLGQGSTFYFSILAEAAVQPATEGFAGKPILVVTEDESLRELLYVILNSWSMQQKSVSSAALAEECLSKGSFDLVLLDLQTDRWDFMMQTARSKSTPVIALGTIGGDAILFSSAVSRPVRPSSLAQAVHRVLQKSRSRATSSLQAASASSKDEMNLSILLAEDNAVNQMVALRMLERLGCRADVATNGLEVCRAMETGHYDVVLMDVQMPEMDGLEATRKIRGMPKISQPYIIAMTAHAMKGDKEECLKAGMDDYVSKPVRIEQLQAALRNSRKEKRGNDQLQRPV